MKHIVVVVTLLSLLIKCTYSTYALNQYSVYERGEPLILTERVGESIDVEERQQFDLFPGISGFREARFYDIKEGGCEILVATDTEKFKIISRDPLTVDILGNYINTCDEPTFIKVNFERKWRIVDYDAAGLPITQIEVNRIKRSTFRYRCGGISFLTCFSISFALLEMNGTQGVWWGLIAGLTGLTAGWRIFGSRMDQKSAIEWIKKSREPRYK